MVKMYAAWFLRRRKVDKRRVYPRYIPNLERCEERLPPGQVFGFDFGLIGDPLTALESLHSRNAASTLPEPSQQTSRPAESVSILAPESVVSKQQPELASYAVGQESGYANINIGYAARRGHVI